MLWTSREVSRNAKTGLLEAICLAYFTTPARPQTKICAREHGRNFSIANSDFRGSRPFLDPGDLGNRSAPRRIEGGWSDLRRREYRVTFRRAVSRRIFHSISCACYDKTVAYQRPKASAMPARRAMLSVASRLGKLSLLGQVPPCRICADIDARLS